MPLWLRNGRRVAGVGVQRLRHLYARIPVGLRFVLLLSLTILGLHIPYRWYSSDQTKQILETQHRIALLHQLKSAQMALKQEMKRFHRHAEDYAVWNDAVSAIQRKDADWLTTNVWEWGVVHLGYESTAVWDAEGSLLGHAGMAPHLLITGNDLYSLARRGVGDVGLVRMGERLFMVACVPVRDEQISSKVYGVMLFANEIDKSTQLALWGTSSIPISLKPLPEQKAEPPQTVQSERKGGQNLSFSYPIKNPEGHWIANLTASIAPSQSLSVRESLRHAQYGSWVLSGIITIGASLMMVVFVRRHLQPFLYVASRLARGDWTARVDYPARDEFGYLAQVFNRMAQNLHQSFEYQERQRKEISARTAELESLHQHLQTLNEELRQKNLQLELAAQTDGLTGLWNHAAFQLALRNEIQRAERLRQPLSLIMLDVDYFKQFNDNYGHPAGDEVLRQVAEVLRRHARPYDIVARYGGEEFAIILVNTELEMALRVAERFRQAIQQIPNLPAPVTASLGVAEHRFGAMPASLLYNADSALYIAKRSGRNQVQFYQEGSGTSEQQQE